MAALRDHHQEQVRSLLDHDFPENPLYALEAFCGTCRAPEPSRRADPILRQDLLDLFGIGMKRNETANLEVCKLLILWWPGTESNRRRQPFQGCALPLRLRAQLSGTLDQKTTSKMRSKPKINLLHVTNPLYK